MSLLNRRFPAAMAEKVKTLLAKVPAGWREQVNSGLFSVALGVAPVLLFLSFFNPYVLNPQHIGWLMEADWGQHVLGWNAFRHVSWASFNHEDLLQAPTGLSVIYTDSNPLFAFTFKLLNPFLPKDFQYIGIWFFFCVCLHFFFAYRLIRPHAPGPWAAFGGALALSALPCLYYRMRHDTLMAQWLILWGLHLFINVADQAPKAIPEGASRLRALMIRAGNVLDPKTRGYMALLGVTGLIHPYLLFMVAAIWSGEVLRTFWPAAKAMDRRALAMVAVRALAVLACPLITLGISGCYAQGQSPGAGGWAYYSMALDALFNPVRPEFSALMKAVPLDAGQSFEGYQYLGFGIILLLVAAAVIYIAAPEAKRAGPVLAKLKPLFLPFLALFLIAITNRVQFYGHTVFFFQMPDQLKNVLAVLRASGRFFWPISYCLITAALIVLFKSRPRVLAAVLPAALLLQAYDLNGFAATMRAATSLAASPQTYYLTPSAKWDKLIAESKGVDFYPANVHFNDKLFYELTWRATSHSLPVNTMYAARENIIQLVKEDEGQAAFRHGQIRNDRLFVFLKQCDAPASLQPKLRMLDGVWIIPPDQAKDIPLDKPVWNPIHSDVRFGWLDQGTCMLDDNWTKPETDGTWSTGPKAGVIIPIKHVQFDEPNPKAVNLDLRAQSRRPVTVTVLVNGTKVSELNLSHQRRNYSIPLPRNALRKDVMDVRFIVQGDDADKIDAADKAAAAAVKLRPVVSSGRGAALAGSSSSQTAPVTQADRDRMLGIKLIDMHLTTAKPVKAAVASALKG